MGLDLAQIVERFVQEMEKEYEYESASDILHTREKLTETAIEIFDSFDDEGLEIDEPTFLDIIAWEKDLVRQARKPPEDW